MKLNQRKSVVFSFDVIKYSGFTRYSPKSPQQQQQQLLQLQHPDATITSFFNDFPDFF